MTRLPAEQVARAVVGLDAWLAEVAPDLVVVAGDVNSTLAGAFAATLVARAVDSVPPWLLLDALEGLRGLPV